MSIIFSLIYYNLISITVLEPKANFVKKLPDITLAVQGSDIKLTVELSKLDVPVKWLRYLCVTNLSYIIYNLLTIYNFTTIGPVK